MVYPRLIFKNEKTSAVSPADTVTDLKLDLLLSEEVTRFLILKPDRDTLLARREMFDALLKDETAPKKVAALKDALGNASTDRLSIGRIITSSRSCSTADFAAPQTNLDASNFSSIISRYVG